MQRWNPPITSPFSWPHCTSSNTKIVLKKVQQCLHFLRAPEGPKSTFCPPADTSKTENHQTGKVFFHKQRLYWKLCPTWWHILLHTHYLRRQFRLLFLFIYSLLFILFFLYLLFDFFLYLCTPRFIFVYLYHPVWTLFSWLEHKDLHCKLKYNTVYRAFY